MTNGTETGVFGYGHAVAQVVAFRWALGASVLFVWFLVRFSSVCRLFVVIVAVSLCCYPMTKLAQA